MTKEKIQLANELVAKEEQCESALSDLRYFMGTGELSLYGGEDDYPGEPLNLAGLLTREEQVQVYQLVYSLVDLHKKSVQQARESL